MKLRKCSECGAKLRPESFSCEFCGTTFEKESVSTNATGATPNADFQNKEVHNTAYTNDFSEKERKCSEKHTPVELPSEKSWIVCLLLAVCAGYIGAQNFYVGKFGMGLLYLFTGGLFCVGWAVDVLLILIKKFRDKKGRLVTND